jgi:hypothetical protein
MIFPLFLLLQNMQAVLIDALRSPAVANNQTAFRTVLDKLADVAAAGSSSGASSSAAPHLPTTPTPNYNFSANVLAPRRLDFSQTPATSSSHPASGSPPDNTTAANNKAGSPPDPASYAKFYTLPSTDVSTAAFRMPLTVPDQSWLTESEQARQARRAEIRDALHDVSKGNDTGTKVQLRIMSCIMEAVEESASAYMRHELPVQDPIVPVLPCLQYVRDVAAARVKDLIIASRVGWQAVTELYNSQLKGDEKLFNNWLKQRHQSKGKRTSDSDASPSPPAPKKSRGARSNSRSSSSRSTTATDVQTIASAAIAATLARQQTPPVSAAPAPYQAAQGHVPAAASRSGKACSYCGKVGHLVASCYARINTEAAAAAAAGAAKK